MTELTPCKYCQMSIPVDAKKCHICEEFQEQKGPGWFKDIGTRVSEISAFITALGVIFGVVTVLDHLPIRHVSEISAYDASSDPSQFTFIFRNDGLRSAFLGPIRIQVDFDGSSADGAAGHRLGERIMNPENSIVNPSSEVTLTLDFELTEELKVGSGNCEVIAEIWDYKKSEPRHIKFTRPCNTESIGSRTTIPQTWKRTPEAVEL